MEASRSANSENATANTALAVRLDGVGVAYRFEKGSYPAVERVDLTVADGEFLSIVGPTGCGKSTLLNLAAGLIAPSEGRIEVLGRPLQGRNPSAGYLFQADALFPWKTALENVAIGFEAARIAPS